MSSQTYIFSVSLLPVAATASLLATTTSVYFVCLSYYVCSTLVSVSELMDHFVHVQILFACALLTHGIGRIAAIMYENDQSGLDTRAVVFTLTAIYIVNAIIVSYLSISELPDFHYLFTGIAAAAAFLSALFRRDFIVVLLLFILLVVAFAANVFAPIEHLCVFILAVHDGLYAFCHQDLFTTTAEIYIRRPKVLATCLRYRTRGVHRSQSSRR
jgi:hypothetical protein